MSAVLLRLPAEQERALGGDDGDALGRPLPGWPMLPEVPGALGEARGGGWSLAAPGQWESSYQRSGADPRSHVHVTAGEHPHLGPAPELCDLGDPPRVLDELVLGA
jgi:hypothetical protein